MRPTALLTALVTLWLAAAGVYQIYAQVALHRLVSRRRRAQGDPQPSATILMPLGRSAPRLEENLGRLCTVGAPVVAGMETADCEAFQAASRVLGRSTPGTLRLVTGGLPPGSNRKIATLIRMMPEVRGEIVIFVDGDIGVPEGYLESLLAPFADPEVGLVTSPYRTVGGTTAASRVDALLTNTAFLPSVALAASIGSVNFALGASVAIRRTVLQEIGGLEPLLEMLADDWALADRASRAGHRIVLAPLLVDHHVGNPGWTAMWQRHLRWARTMRALSPSGYAGTLVAHGWFPALGLAMLTGWSKAAASLAAWGIVRLGGVLLNGRRTGCGPLELLLLPVADLLSLALFVGGMCGRAVRWGETRLYVGRGGAILPSSHRPQPSRQTRYGT